MALVSEYFRLKKIHTEETGDRTVILMQIGTFYEIYFLEEDMESNELPQILPSRLTLKDTKDLANAGTIRNPYMVGFPVVSYELKKEILLNNNYYIVTYNQTKYEKTRRELYEKSSPLTQNNAFMKTDVKNTNNICCIYIEALKEDFKVEGIPILIGMASIDVVTGKNWLREVYTSYDDCRHAINDLYRCLSSSKPKELQIYVKLGKNDINKERLEKYLYETLELDTYPIMNLSFEIHKDMLNPNYQEHFLSKVFKITPTDSQIIKDSAGNFQIYLNRGSILNIFTELGIEKLQHATVAYLLLLRYCHESNPLLIKKIRKPQLDLDSDDYLILEHNAAVQLNLIPSGITKVNYRVGKRKKFDTILSVLDATNTPMGKRVLRERMLKPLLNIDVLNTRYSIIEYLRGQPELIKNTKSILKQLYDIEKLNLKLIRENITPKELSNLVYSYKLIIDIFNLVLPHLKGISKIFPTQQDLVKFNNFIGVIYNTFDIEILEECNLTNGVMTCRNSPILPKVLKESDELQEQLDDEMEHLNKICRHLEVVLNVSPGSTVEVGSFSKKAIKGKSVIDDKDEEVLNMRDFAIYLTDAKTKTLKSYLHKVDAKLCGNLKLENKNKKWKIRSEIIDEHCYNVLMLRNTLSPMIYKIYKDLLKFINETYDLNSIVNFIIELDLSICNTENSLRYNYHKPIIEKRAYSFLEVKDLRHPLVERIIDTEYISNDVSLGIPGSMGILLYACNSAGKSVLTNSVGDCIIMAQAGMYVPGKLKFNPYKKIITRLSGNDDILKGHSSFIVEMLELRTIIRNIDEHTLVLGDELCKGTESLSGTAITVTALTRLCNEQTSFIFSTHLHEVPHIKKIETLVQKNLLKIYHMETIFDYKTESLIYNRKLKEGPGDSIYGLEVAKSMEIDNDFIHEAYLTRKELQGESMEFVDFKKSRYNTEIFVDVCSSCGSKTNLHTHHIKEQSEADSKGMIGNHHKNAKFNLIILCEKCHTNLHANGYTLKPVNTSAGTILYVAENARY